MKQRIIGFDLARAYAIFGMFIVNFNIIFGIPHDNSNTAKLLQLFSGNSSTIFVMLAGLGVALMTNRQQQYNAADRKRLRLTLLKRAGFLTVLGMILSVWWPADILHFYGAYMLIASAMIFLHKKYYLIAAVASVLIFHLLLLFIPYETGWNFNTLQYADQWTITGFIRHTFYNGWNSFFPWFAYFATGMYLGRLNWTLRQTKYQVFLTGWLLFLPVAALQYFTEQLPLSNSAKEFINADYLPPLLPFILSTTGFGLMLITAFVYISQRFKTTAFFSNLARTGQMTLTHYISHLTIGIVIFALLKPMIFPGSANDPVTAGVILLYAVIWFVACYFFSCYWGRQFTNGPFEWMMRRTAG